MSVFLRWVPLMLLLACVQGRNVVLVRDGEALPGALSELDHHALVLLQGYLYLYGNSCEEIDDEVKCSLLKAMHIEDECDETYRKTLSSAFKYIPLLKYKFAKCPVISDAGGVQNRFADIDIRQQGATLSIHYKIRGLNHAQEKNWVIEKTDDYRLSDSHFIRKKGR